MSFAIFELKCPDCGVEYAQMLSENDEVTRNLSVLQPDTCKGKEAFR